MIWNFVWKIYNKIKPKKMSENGIKLLESKGIEDKRLKPYDDQTSRTITEWCPGATIGIGHLISKSNWDKYKNGIDDETAYELLDSDIKIAENGVKKNIKIKINQNQFDALCIFVFNIGVGHFMNSSVLKLINNSKADTIYDSLEDAWKAWNKSRGNVMGGLINRRERELKLYNTQI